MNNSQIECFIVLAKTRNFTKAAELMFITQPAFSRRIATLEEEVGVKLVGRYYQDVRLTTAGERFLPYCIKASNALKEGVMQAKLCKKGTLGQLRIGFLCDAREEKLGRTVCRFREAYPEVEIVVKEFTHLKAEQALENHDIDIGFFNSHNIANMENIRTRVLDTSPQCIVVPKDHPFAALESVSARQLAEEKFILLSREDSLFYNILQKICRPHGFEPRVIRWAQVVPAIFTLVGCGVGVSFLSSKTALLAPASIKYVRLLEAEVIDHLATWRNGNTNPCLLNFINMLE